MLISKKILIQKNVDIKTKKYSSIDWRMVTLEVGSNNTSVGRAWKCMQFNCHHSSSDCLFQRLQSEWWWWWWWQWWRRWRRRRRCWWRRHLMANGGSISRLCFRELKILLVAIETTREESHDKYIAINPGPSVLVESNSQGFFIAQSAADVKMWMN